jgi:hypothetical protein
MSTRTPGRTRVAYKLSHQWMRRRLNAGCDIGAQPQATGSEWIAARDAVLATGRLKAPTYDHALHYHGTYVRRAAIAKATGSAA